MAGAISYYTHKGTLKGLEMYIRIDLDSRAPVLRWPHDFDHFTLYHQFGPREFIKLTGDDEITVRQIYRSKGRDAAVQYLLTYVNTHLAFGL